MRRRHILKRNQTNRIVRRMIWVDTEALNAQGRPEAGRQSLFFGVALYDSYAAQDSPLPQAQDSLLFKEINEFWAWVESKTLPRRALWVLAHNWNYDAGILNASGLKALGWKPTKYINGKPPLIVRFVKNEATILLVDTLNYFRTSLDLLGNSLGIPKLEMPKNVGNMWDYRGDELREWYEYAWRDVEIIRVAFLRFRAFVREHNLGVLQATLASQAFTAYRHRFMPEEILVHNNTAALGLERASYHGGRTESFWRGKVAGNVHKLDINSMYPAIMEREKLAVKFLGYFGEWRAKWWADAIAAGRSLVARCDIDTDIPVYGVVKDERLIFPIGKFTTVLTTPEIRFGLARGHIRRVHEWAMYESANIFQDFVRYFVKVRAEYRAEGNEAFTYMAKILMNSLYGKWGQNGRKWVETNDYPDWRESSQEEWYQFGPGDSHKGLDTWVKLRVRLGQVQVLKTDSEAENSCPIIAAEITAYGRIWLWKLTEKAGTHAVYYVDTDSLFTTDMGLENLLGMVDPEILGLLKVEGVSDNTEFLAPKHYLFDGAWVIKGVSKKARPVFGPFQNAVAAFDQETFRSWDNNLKHGVDGYIDVVPTRKHISGINTKRVYTGDGWTESIVLDE